MGLQGSGKSTFYRTHFAATHALVSKDRFRNNRRPARRQRQLLEEALAAGQSVVVDNTNPTAQDRRELIEIGRSFSARVVGYFFAAPLDECLERNRQRAGRERVPDVALYATLKRLQRPTLSEGFDRLFSVRPAGDCTFEIRDWAEAPASEEGP
jgi:predicted kinase